MSDYLAVGGVSAVLRSLLTNALTNGGPTAILGSSPGITATSPDLVPIGANETARVNLFMYYASLNPALRNMALPSRNSQGTAVDNEPLALNLHYLVSAYGSHQFDPEILLAWAMKVFHDTPVVPRAIIQTALTDLLNNSQVSPEAQLISGTTLANQLEQVRITPETLTTEEIYRLWTAFQTSYRPTTSYQVSVIVIRDTRAFTSNPPVQKRTVSVLPFNVPVIDSLAPSMVATGDSITLKGRNFLGDLASDTLVSFDGSAGVAPTIIQSTSLQVMVPGNLQPGTRSLRVVRSITFPASATPHAGFTSSPVPFQLLPTIVTPAPITAAHGSTLTLHVTPAVGSMQSVTLHIGDRAIPIDARPTTDPPTSTTLAFSVPSDIPVATYSLRLEVDGAQSKLAPDTTQGSSTFGQLLPQIQVTP
jgi:Pvc16 N-terminal domain/IPT/TIG domain